MKVLDLFCGCGGLSLGLEQAGFDIELGIDIWQDALTTFKANHIDSETHCQDLSEVNFDEVSNRYLPTGVDLIVGGPPCQGFSISGKRDPDDPRNKLYTAFLKAVDHFKPKAFIMENVPNLASMNQGKIRDTIVKEFESIGYTVSHRNLLASDFGVPQNRRRFIMVGLLGGDQFDFPSPTHMKNKISCEQAISDLVESSIMDGAKYPLESQSLYQAEMRVGSSGVFNHETTKHTEKTVSIISLVPDGGNYKALPDSLKGIRNVNIAWTRYNSQKPSLTIDTGHRHHFHYKFNRVPTVRESARLQSFPDKFVFLCSKTSQYKQVGNAVPPILGRVLGEQLKKHL
ncbi:DNA cytosine methyltransferase [Piscirickettsia litoralis]|uniref:DNA cytosine methyltransferase n=1 Tax=Piscirickettsia litoralis TaxID=1891921 RepID=UPI000AB8FEB0|nr:DNA cytosine methyltransferase [Piscirickettsia litoralis]